MDASFNVRLFYHVYRAVQIMFSYQYSSLFPLERFIVSTLDKTRAGLQTNNFSM